MSLVWLPLHASQVVLKLAQRAASSFVWERESKLFTDLSASTQNFSSSCSCLAFSLSSFRYSGMSNVRSTLCMDICPSWMSASATRPGTRTPVISLRASLVLEMPIHPKNPTISVITATTTNPLTSFVLNFIDLNMLRSSLRIDPSSLYRHKYLFLDAFSTLCVARDVPFARPPFFPALRRQDHHLRAGRTPLSKPPLHSML